ncbi:hypothetical protein [Streptomyces sp. NPDC086023]|uniref:hypothetical protein n=1 Tax=Streptomyces sp. NPDC086023 TaxID=3365746 RepID=UPI0037D7C492
MPAHAPDAPSGAPSAPRALAARRGEQPPYGAPSPELRARAERGFARFLDRVDRARVDRSDAEDRGAAGTPE